MEAFEALLWGEKYFDKLSIKKLKKPLAGIWRQTFYTLYRVGWVPGPRKDKKRNLLQVLPTSKEVANFPCLQPRPEPDEDVDIPVEGALAARAKAIRKVCLVARVAVFTSCASLLTLPLPPELNTSETVRAITQ
jgi:hypothetical protein